MAKESSLGGLNEGGGKGDGKKNTDSRQWPALAGGQDMRDEGWEGILRQSSSLKWGRLSKTPCAWKLRASFEHGNLRYLEDII